jgi:hypothetical protein
MGGSKSKSKIRNENNTKIVNRSDINILNEQINNSSSNTATDAAKSCSSSVIMKNMLDFSGAIIDGDFNIGGGGSNPNEDCAVELSQSVKSTFKCTQTSSVRNDMAQKMVETVMTNLENSADASVLNDMNSTAASAAETGSISMPGGGGAKSSSEVETINNFESVTETNKDIQNIVKNSVENNFSSKDAQECINKVNAAQGLDASGSMIRGSVNVCKFKSDQVADIFGECMQNSDVGNKVLNDITRDLGITIKEDSSAGVENQTVSTAESSAVQTGIIGEIGDMISGIFGMFGLAAMAPILSPISVACCVICCCVILLMLMMGGSKGGGNSSDDSSSSGSSSGSSKSAMDGGNLFTPDYEITTYYSTTSLNNYGTI